jgi:putative NADH-flavin reductase
MKIAITGHTAGIGAAFARCLLARGHEIIGISKREGHNIRNIPKVVAMIEPADLWINNAQSGYSQTELLYKVWESWRGEPEKMIWSISTILATDTRIINIPGMAEISVAEYKNQKRSLEDAFYQLKSQASKPSMMLIRPGAVATQPGQIPNEHGADPDAWANTIVDFYLTAKQRNLYIPEISVGFKLDSLDL